MTREAVLGSQQPLHLVTDFPFNGFLWRDPTGLDLAISSETTVPGYLECDDGNPGISSETAPARGLLGSPKPTGVHEAFLGILSLGIV